MNAPTFFFVFTLSALGFSYGGGAVCIIIAVVLSCLSQIDSTDIDSSDTRSVSSETGYVNMSSFSRYGAQTSELTFDIDDYF